VSVDILLVVSVDILLEESDDIVDDESLPDLLESLLLLQAAITPAIVMIANNFFILLWFC
jgi:hypothetical protein